ncbi:MAG: hypothetical protein M3O70_23250 [Actinomycetota bacterium]|nr:hypothetical protein [Actinomycetota bacterium]
MTEEHGPYELHHDDKAEGVERIGDVLRQLIDERGWPQSDGIEPVNGDRPGADDVPRHGDV